MNYTTYTVKIYEHGDKYWYNEKGEYHNEHGPAIEWPDGYKEYHLNGKLHRIDGPAIEWSDGSKTYSLNGHCYPYEDWKKEVNKSKVEELTVSEISKKLGFQVKIIEG